MSEDERATQALELWNRWLDEDGNPWQCNDYGEIYCFFCSGEYLSHDPDCIYVLAANLLDRELVTEIGL